MNTHSENSGLELAPMRRFGRRAVARFKLSHAQLDFLPPIRKVLSRFRLKRCAREFVIWVDDQAVGYFQLNFSEQETAHYASGGDVCGLEAMCIDYAWQGHGIAGRALRLLPSLLAREHSAIARVNLTVACHNIIAIRAYEKAGFVNTMEVLKIRGDHDQYVMTLQVHEQQSTQRDVFKTYAAA